MNVFDYIIGGLLLLMAVFLVVAIMLQSGKGKGLSGTIAGGSSDSYFGKNKGKTRDQVLSRLTTVVAIVFVVLVLLLYIFQGFEVGGDTSSTGHDLFGRDLVADDRELAGGVRVCGRGRQRGGDIHRGVGYGFGGRIKQKRPSRTADRRSGGPVGFAPIAKEDGRVSPVRKNRAEKTSSFEGVFCRVHFELRVTLW